MDGCMDGWTDARMDGRLTLHFFLAVLLQRGPEIARSVPDRAGHRDPLCGHTGPHGGSRGVGQGKGAVHGLQVRKVRGERTSTFNTTVCIRYTVNIWPESSRLNNGNVWKLALVPQIDSRDQIRTRTYIL